MKKTKIAAKAASRAASKRSAGLSGSSQGGRGGGAALDLVRDLACIATEYDLAELELEPSGRVRISRRRAGGGEAVPPASAHHAPAAAPPQPSAAPAAPAADADSVAITSPFVGTFYRAPGPDAGPFVDLGQSIRKGQVVCIIEAMKLMNEIESEVEGKVVEVLVKNGEHVEYGQPLFRVQKA